MRGGDDTHALLIVTEVSGKTRPPPDLLEPRERDCIPRAHPGGSLPYIRESLEPLAAQDAALPSQAGREVPGGSAIREAVVNLRQARRTLERRTRRFDMRIREDGYFRIQPKCAEVTCPGHAEAIGIAEGRK